MNAALLFTGVCVCVCLHACSVQNGVSGTGNTPSTTLTAPRPQGTGVARPGVCLYMCDKCVSVCVCFQLLGDVIKRSTAPTGGHGVLHKMSLQNDSTKSLAPSAIVRLLDCSKILKDRKYNIHCYQHSRYSLGVRRGRNYELGVGSDCLKCRVMKEVGVRSWERVLGVRRGVRC